MPVDIKIRELEEAAQQLPQGAIGSWEFQNRNTGRTMTVFVSEGNEREVRRKLQNAEDTEPSGAQEYTIRKVILSSERQQQQRNR